MAEAAVDVNALRERFPNPQRFQDCLGKPPGSWEARDWYCVGGALCRFLGLRDPMYRFPGRAQLERSLTACNPVLAVTAGRGWSSAGSVFATDVLRYNDLGDFERAWETLHRALTWREGEPPGL